MMDSSNCLLEYVQHVHPFKHGMVGNVHLIENVGKDMHGIKKDNVVYHRIRYVVLIVSGMVHNVHVKKHII